MTAADLIAALRLAPHPEGGHFRETFRDEGGTAIYFLLQRGERSRWHRVLESAETWHYYRGAPLALSVSLDGLTAETIVLGPAVAADQQPQAVVPRGAWQAARSLGDYTLVGCTVAPPFRFEAFELAPEDFAPVE